MRNPALAMALLLAGATAAAAHAMLEHATPAGGGALVKAPAVVTLQFSEALEPAFSGISVADENGREVTAAPSSADGTTMRVLLKPLTPGSYHVGWHAVSVDTHRTEGAYNFRIVP